MKNVPSFFFYIIIFILTPILPSCANTPIPFANQDTHHLPTINNPPLSSTVRNANFSCTGNVHAQVLDLWNNSLKKYYQNQINVGLIKTKDTYVLYNSEEFLHAFVRMARRCNNVEVLSDLAETFYPALNAQVSIPNNPQYLGWVCGGGRICNNKNHLFGTEVNLCSVQFLGLLATISTAIIEDIPEKSQSDIERKFVSQTAISISSHLDRWLSPKMLKTIQARRTMTPAIAVNNTSSYFFTDQDLWAIDLIAELSELHNAKGKVIENDPYFNSLQSKRTQISQLIDLLLSRITISNDSNTAQVRAEIDAGYDRSSAESKFSAYNGNISPVDCTKGDGTSSISVQWKPSYSSPTVGWDFSHTRRLVPALDALRRNKDNLRIVFGYNNPKLNPEELSTAFSNQLIDKIWNQNKEFPLFTNFWNGSNGWYRVGYNNGTGCYSGNPPFGLVDAFPSGGYIEWGRFNPQIKTLGVRLYQLFNSIDATSVAFNKKYYFQGFGSITGRNLELIAFLPTLVDL